MSHRNQALFPDGWEAPDRPDRLCGTGRFALTLLVAAAIGAVLSIVVVTTAWVVHQAATAGLVR